MFSRIDPLFKTLFRHAESADTRQELKRKDPLLERHGEKKDNPSHEDSPLWEDETDVSIEALSSFLHTLLGDKNHIFNNQSAQTPPPQKPSEDSSYAINAYQKTSGEQTRSINITEDEPQAEESEFKLDEKERPTVEKLLKDLEELKKRNVEYLVVSKTGTFFESVKDAIESAHDTFNL